MMKHTITKKIVIMAITATGLLYGSKSFGQQWTTSGSNIYNNNTGNVGIGIGLTSPYSPLDVAGYMHVSGNASPGTSAQGGYFSWNGFTGGTGETDFINNQGGGSGGFAFFNTNTSTGWSGRTNLMLITGAGLVGIGNYLSSSHQLFNQLEVQGSVSVYNSDANYSLFFGQDKTANHQYGTWGIQYVSDNTHQGNGGLNFWKPSGNDIYGYNNYGNAFLFLRDNGNVGIGTASPSYLLDVNGVAHISGTLTLGASPSNNWTTPSSSPYTQATASGYWSVPLIIPNGGAIRTASTGTNGRYVGFGMVDGPSSNSTPTGWYWIVQGATNTSAPACYPMTLLMDGSGNATLTISQNGWADYVFDNKYIPMSIDEKEKYYKLNKHLPGVDSTAVIDAKGLNITKNMKGMMMNIEEDRLDITALNKIILQQEVEINELKEQVRALNK